MPTEKLYYLDTYLREFDAEILTKTALPGGKFSVTLDRTAFYPEGGGQPCDLGTLGGVPVIDVRTVNGEIIHTTEGDPGDSTISGRLDWQRRFDHMQQHTGEHILSGILLTHFQAENVGFHLSATSCQIDATLPSLSLEQATFIEDMANAVIFANLPVEGRFVESADLSSYSLRKEPGKEFDQIRLVSVKDCDCCPCGGTHVGRTGEAGLFKIRGWEKRKNNIRLDFVSGGRALADYRVKHDITKVLSNRFSAPLEGILPAVERAQEKLEGCQADLSATRKAFHVELASSLLASPAETGDSGPTGPRIISRIFQNYSIADLQDFAARITSVGGICLLASSDAAGERASFLFAAAENPPVHMNELLKKALASSGGKGGGNALQAQGGAPSTAPDVILAEAEAWLRQKQ